MVLHLPEQNTTRYGLQPTALIETVVYLDQSRYGASKSGSQPWRGYGGY
jgi:hypothetical protein